MHWRTWWRRSPLAWLLWGGMVLAAVVTAADVANAIRNSANSTPWMREHADEIGALAVKVESGGNTQAYNGTCCYGVLQLNTANILAAGYTVEEYRNASLQTQIDGWAMIQAQALNDPVIQQLTSSGTFDGQPVDASMVIACVQLGQGNCRTMINSGRCDGFADRNGTTICSMAATMRAATGGATAGTGAGSPPAGGSGGAAGGGAPAGAAPPAGGGMFGGASPGTFNATAAFEAGAGTTSANVRETAALTVAAFLSFWLAWTAAGMLTLLTSGRVHTMHLAPRFSRAVVVFIVVLVLLQ